MDLTSLVLSRAEAAPGAPAVEAPDGDATYGELVTRAAQLAVAYRDAGVRPGDLVGLVLPAGRDLIAAALAAFLCDAAYVPVDPVHPPERVAQVLRGCGPALVVDATTDLLAGPWPVGAGALPPERAGALPPERAGGGGGEVAYVIHTSGSTGAPKGVLVPHASIVNLIAEVDRVAPVPDAPRGSWWCSPDFDVSVWEMWSPLIRGGTVVVVPPQVRWEGPRLVAHLDRAGITSAYVPPAFLADLRDAMAQRPEALSALRRLLVGVEPIPLGLLQDMLRRRPALAVVNGYGPAEATVCCTLYRVPADGGDPALRTPIGWAVPGNQLYLVDEAGLPAAADTGELVVAGVNVALGYLRSAGDDPPDARFVPDPGGDPAVRAYRTGDLVRRLPDGSLLYLGRVDRQLKVRGYRIEPAEVERAIRTVYGEVAVVVDARTVRNAGTALVAYLVAPQQAIDDAGLGARLARVLPAHAVPSAYLSVADIPLTPNGKVDRQALAAVPMPTPAVPVGAAGDDPAAAPSGQVALVLDTFAKVLGRPAGPADSLVALGGTSLTAAGIAAALRDITGLDVSAGQVLAAEDAAELAAVLDAAPQLHEVAATGAMRGPLNPNQLGLLLHDQADPGNSTYAEPVCFQLTEPVDVPRLSRAFTEAVSAYPAFGARVDLDDDEPALELAAWPITLTVRQVDDGEPSDPAALLREELSEPFDLEDTPLMRGTLLVRADGTGTLLLLFHHIVVDGWSVRLFLRDLARCYRYPGHRPEPSRMTLVDANEIMAADARHPDRVARRARAAMEARDAAAWQLPGVRARGEGHAFEVRVGALLLGAVTAAAATLRIPRYVMVNTAYQRALARVLGTNEFALGCASSGRYRPEFERVSGYFVNTVLIPATVAADPDPGNAVSDLLAVSRRWRQALTAQGDIPFAGLVTAIRATGLPLPPRLPHIYLSIDDDYELVLDGRSYPSETLLIQRAKFPITMVLRVNDAAIAGYLEHGLDVLSEDRGAQLVAFFAQELAVLASAVDNAGQIR